MANATSTLKRRPTLLTSPRREPASGIVTIPDTIAGMACPGCGCSLSACVGGGCGHGCCCRSGHHVQEICTICFGTGWYYAAPDAVLTRCPRNC